MGSAMIGESSIGSWMTPVVRRLLWINGILYLVKFLTGLWDQRLWHYVALTPDLAFHEGMVWQFFTYMYVHFDLTHVLFNLFGLFMFGRDVEQVFGSARFFTYYTICGFGAALAACFAYPHSAIVGSSGAIYGVLLAFAILFPYRPVYLMFIPVPIQARWFIVFYGALDLMYSIEGGGNVAYVAHLGGLATGIIYFWVGRRFKNPFVSTPFPIQTDQPSLLSRWATSIRAKRQKRRDQEDRLTQAELDGILDKIAKSGMTSLTKQERLRLKNASADMRKRSE